ncbi:hypothetical protein A2955_03430 [Candidatus Woesebacteria bacterium RIFCSPLOWO2_01_FULL_37_19]|uniref:ATP synthase gamma chain n=1 Tax=Candidatus Woesebacteria bacterium RIFCSPLOWO2_01_FULL_37_19 TaxID=1802514 RepID=A0A1F8B465_9BACT|nr:MAG: hypothetical protein A2955_03430 [Candidatus Woesebacteria bacterium RIFCSPLOWO2_01_FULL_37_19]
MYSRKEFTENINAATSIKSITTIYQEIASLRMNQLKDKVARTSAFLDGVAEIYNHAKSAYIDIIKSQTVKKDKAYKELKFIKRNGKTVLVFLSANEHLYGELILNVWDKFREDKRQTGLDGVVVGTFGKYLVKNESGLDDNVKYFDLDDDKPGQDQINKILDYISKYEQIFVYYGRLITVLNQSPTKEQISGGATLEQKVASKKYLFEPSPQKILEFFETEIISALFNQKVFDHQLSRFASRMVAMDQATENANEIIKKLDRQYKTIKRRVLNKKQQDVFSGILLWNKGVNP